MTGPSESSFTRENFLFFCLFLVFSCLYFARIFHDGLIQAQSDAFFQYYPLKAFYGAELRKFNFPLWNPFESAGLPYLGALNPGALYPLNLLLYFLMPAQIAFYESFLLHYAFAGFFTFLYLRMVGCGRISAVAGGIVFSFSGFMIYNQLHTPIINSAIWLPLIMLFAEKLRRKPEMKYSLLLALGIGVQILAGNFQVCFYTYIVLFFFFLFSIFGLEKGLRLKFLLFSAIGLLLGFVIAAPQILSAAELGSLSARNEAGKVLGYLQFANFKTYFKSFPSLIFPNLFREEKLKEALSIKRDNVEAFIGIIPFLLGGLFFIRNFRQNRLARFWGFIAVLGLFLATANQTPLWKVLYKLPVYGDFRAHARNLFEFSFAFSILFSLGLNEFLDSGKYIKSAIVSISALILLSFCAFFLLRAYVPGLQYLSLSNPDIYVPLLIMGSALIVFLIYRFFSGAKRVLPYALLILISLEAYSYGNSFFNAGITIEKIDRMFEKRGYGILQSLSKNDLFRLGAAGNTIDLFNIPYGFGLFNSYDQMMARDYARLMELDLMGVSWHWDFLIANNTLLSMLNVKYIEIPDSGGKLLNIAQEASIKNQPSRPALVKSIPLNQTLHGRELKLEEINLDKGVYLAEVSAKGPGPETAMEFEAFPKREQWKNQYYPSCIYPGFIKDTRKIYRIISLPGPDDIYLSVRSINGAVQLENISVYKIDGYGPFPMGTPDGNAYRAVYKTGNGVIFENKNCLPRAYSVSTLLPAGDIDEIKYRFDLQEVNPAEEALLFSGDFKETGNPALTKGRVSVEEYGLNKVSLKADFPGLGFLVLADQYFPGWHAYVDGKETKIYPANGVLRGILVPAGAHNIVFSYRPYALFASFSLSLITFAVICFYFIKKRFRKQTFN